MTLQQISNLIEMIPKGFLVIALTLIIGGAIHWWLAYGSKWWDNTKNDIVKKYNRHQEILEAGVDYMVDDIHRHFAVILNECLDKGYKTTVDIERWGRLHTHYEKFLGNTDYKYLENEFEKIPLMNEAKIPLEIGCKLPSKDTMRKMAKYLTLLQSGVVSDTDINLPINKLKRKGEQV